MPTDARVEWESIRPRTDSRFTLPIEGEVDRLEHDHNAEEQYKKGATSREFDTTFCENPRVKKKITQKTEARATTHDPPISDLLRVRKDRNKTYHLPFSQCKKQ